MDNRPIGVFDSGLGGLTALEELASILPDEHIIYLGDSYNMPYGEKTPQQIIDMSLNNLKFLISKDVKAVFIACGTATSNALEDLRQNTDIPVYGVVEAAVERSLENTKNGKIGLLATKASVEAGTYQRLLHELNPDIEVTSKACPKFATMVEYGIFDKHHESVRSAAEEYLPPLIDAQVDTVILGCTHYPLLADAISDYMGNDVTLISSGAAAADSLSEYLRDNEMLSQNKQGKIEYFTTGDSNAFVQTAGLMLGRNISPQLTKIKPFSL